MNLALLALAVLAAGCGDKSPEEMVVGNWNCEMEFNMGTIASTESCQLTFEEDGTFTNVAKTSLDTPKGKIKMDYNYHGDWSLSDNKLIYYYRRRSDKH